MRPWRMALIASFSADAVTPARARIFPASVSFSIASASSRRSTVTNLSLALSAAFSAVSKSRSSSRVACGWEAAPETLGCRAMTASTSRRTCADLPPARSISPAAMPSGSSNSAFRICSGVNCGCPSRIAMVCAACRKPCARSV